LKPPKLSELDPSEVVVLAGAGISVEEPSGIPAAWGLLDALLKWAAPTGRARGELTGRMAPGSDFNPYRFLRFEGFIQAVAEIDPNIFYYLESTEAFGGPNANHRLLAEMALRGATIITTNFDTRIEQAVGNRYLSTFVLSPKRRVPTASDRLIKIHGSFPWRRGRNVTPRATLTQIGKMGLGFEHFPEFRDWFRKATVGKHLVVVGYSASDSFDAVPLIESCSEASTVTWFSYRPGGRGLRVTTVRPAEDRTPFPSECGTDFVAHTLKRLASRQSRTSSVYRVYGGSVEQLLKAMIRLPRDERPISSWGEPVGARNLTALRTTLAENPLIASQRRIILRLLDEGMFGEAYATAEEAKPVRRGNQVVFVESKKRFAPDTAEQRAQTAFQQGNPNLAFKILENAASETPDRDQILLLLHHFEFRFWEREGNGRKLTRVVRKTERLSRQSGVLWGLIMAEWMKSFRLEAEWRLSVDKERKNELTREIIACSERTVYYAVRAGWQEWFAATARLAAKHRIILGEFDKAEKLLTRLLTWLDRETSDGIEEIAATACALNTLGIQSGRPSLTNRARRILSNLDTRVCPVVKLLRIAAEAEVAHARREWGRFYRLERSASEHLLKLDPADHWGVKDVFDYLRRSAASGKEAHV
jgi:tetratricopeptide (TPR) repeat protein